MEQVVQSEQIPARRRSRRAGTGKAFLVFKIVMFVIFLIYAISLLYPILFGFLSSLKTQSEYSNAPTALPVEWLFSNYIDAFVELSADGADMFTMLFNSLWYTVGGTVLGIFVSMMTAYVAAKYEFPGKKLVYGISVFVMMIPIVGAMPSQFRIYTALGIINSPALLISFASGVGFNFIVLYAFYQSLSWEYAEAAFIDGAGDFRVFIQVMVPQTMSVVLALAVVTCVTFWNDYMGPLLFLKSYPTLATGIYRYKALSVMNQNMPVYFAALIMSMIPVVALYIAFQNKMMDLSLGGGIKG
ncbi:MAG TPA: carbohydrate ABC transporter permease [Candidatus Borkfalkia avicola]|uniref:Carbohydrate ABC transporter permease n=1 Tax=Candidatus Borkfalkia avicola TaxID=2838503 RepID=A0A9D2D774_9FIRM|nr:carbohydrate ABC transporter permease [Candidatus Borkfalkia avicola]